MSTPKRSVQTNGPPESLAGIETYKIAGKSDERYGAGEFVNALSALIVRTLKPDLISTPRAGAHSPTV
jgi:hypothetical protein